jgi:hypothetical protein
MTHLRNLRRHTKNIRYHLRNQQSLYHAETQNVCVDYQPDSDKTWLTYQSLCVFKIINMADIPKGARIFNSQFVDEIKNKGTDKAFEKSRLVV